MTRTGSRTWLALLLPLALAAAAYARVLHGEFVFDDLLTGPASPTAQDLASAAGGAWQAFWMGGRPVTDLTFALNRRLGGPDPWSYHLLNVGLHLATALLLWRLARAVLERAGAARAEWQAVAVAGLWVVHPLCSQAVSYVTQRSEILASGLMAAALLAFLDAGRRWPTRRGLAALALGTLAFGVALGAKAMAVTTPLLWALLEWATPAGPTAPAGGWRVRALAFLAPAGLAAAHALATVRSLGPVGNAGFDLAGFGPWSYLLTQLRVVLTYARLVLWPAGLSVDWAVEPSVSLLEPSVLGAGALLLILAAGAVALLVAGRRRGGADWAAARVAGLGVLWFFLVLAPTSSVVPLADPLVEHRAYLASWGLLLGLVAAGERVAARAPWRHAGLAAGAAVLAVWLALAVALHARNAVWESTLALWTDATAGGRGTSRAHVGLGVARTALGDLPGALDAYREAYRRARGRPFEEVHALHNSGVLLAQQGNLAEAERMLRMAVERAPKGVEMAFTLGYVLWRRGNLAGAEVFANRALELSPGHVPSHHLLGMVRLDAGQVDAALVRLEAAVRLAPDDGGIRADLGFGLRRAGRTEEACGAWLAALRLRAEPSRHDQTRQWMAAAGCAR